ncbi:MAG: 50S ribosomal protein L18e [Thermoplasmata archaeon]
MTLDNKTNQNIVRLVKYLKARSRNKSAPIWRDVAERLEKPSKNWAEVNLSTIQRFAKEGDTVLVPGKVLGAGYLSKKVNIGSFSISQGARKKVEDAGGSYMDIREMAKKNPKGSGIRIMG